MKDLLNRRDLLASVVVFLVALPLCMGIAIASGVPPARGLVTGIIGGIVTGYLAGSPLQVSGPAAGLTVLVYELITTYGIAWLGVAVMGAGLLQWLAGRFGFGRAFQAVSPAVVKGMLGGIGVLIFASQFHVLVDDQPRKSGLENLLAIPEAIAKGLSNASDSTHQLAALIGLSALFSIILWERFKPRQLSLVPAPLVAVTVATGLAWMTGWGVKKIEVPSALGDFFALPSADLVSTFNPAIIVSIVAIAFIASAETLLAATAVDAMHDGVRTDYNQELKAQGIGNLCCGLLGALPMTGVIVRSSANIKAGAVSRASAVLHGVWLAAFVFLVPDLLAQIPTSALAAILVYIGWKLVDIQAIRSLHKHSRWEVAIYLVTLLAIVATDLLTGVLAGVGLAVLRVLISLAHLEVKVDGACDQVVEVTLSGAATFLSLPKLSAALETVEKGKKVCLHLEPLLFVDHACLGAIEEFARLYERQGGTVVTEWQMLNTLSADTRLRLVG